MERKHKKLWVIHDNRVMHLEGYECPPNEGYWWFPAIQYSCCEKYHVFNSEKEALDTLISSLIEQRKTLNKETYIVKRRLKKMEGE